MQRVQLSVLDLILQINFLKQATGKRETGELRTFSRVGLSYQTQGI